MEEKTSALGVISLTCSILAFFIFGLPLSIVAILTGLIGWSESNIAKVGAIIGIVEVTTLIIFLLMI